MATAPAGGGSALELSYITELLAKSQPGRALPTVILCCEDEEAEVKILVHLVRCRASGFMGILPALDLVSRVLDGMVNAEGDPLAVFRDVTIAVLDSGGRKFGNADVLLVDFSAECVGQFRRGPALRSSGGAGIFRLRVGEAVARPAPRSAWEAAEAWIQEMAEQDASMQEYLTAQEEDPPGDGADVPSGGDAAVVAQLQARILELESQQATPVQTPPARPPLHFEPPLRDPVQRSSFWRSTSRRSFGQSRSSEAAAIYGRPCSQSIVSVGSKTKSKGRTYGRPERSSRVGCWGAPRGGVSSFGSGRGSASSHTGIATSTDSSIDPETNLEDVQRPHHKRPGQRRRQLKLKWSARLRGEGCLSTSSDRHPGGRSRHHDECCFRPWVVGTSDWQWVDEAVCGEESPSWGPPLVDLHGSVHGLQLAGGLRPSRRASPWSLCSRPDVDRTDIIGQRPLPVRLAPHRLHGAGPCPDQYAQAEVGDQAVRQVGRCSLGSGQRGVPSGHRLPRDSSSVSFLDQSRQQCGQGEGGCRPERLAQEEKGPEQRRCRKHHSLLNDVAVMHAAQADEPVLCSRSGRSLCSTGVNVKKHSNEFQKDLQGFEASSNSPCQSLPLPTFQETPEQPFSFLSMIESFLHISSATPTGLRSFLQSSMQPARIVH